VKVSLLPQKPPTGALKISSSAGHRSEMERRPCVVPVVTWRGREEWCGVLFLLASPPLIPTYQSLIQNNEEECHMSQEWYFAKGDKRYGPVSASQLKELAITGRLSPNDIVWKQGMAQWSEARIVRGLFPTLPSSLTPPPLPAQKQSNVARDDVDTVLKSPIEEEQQHTNKERQSIWSANHYLFDEKRLEEAIRKFLKHPQAGRIIVAMILLIVCVPACLVFILSSYDKTQFEQGTILSNNSNSPVAQLSSPSHVVSKPTSAIKYDMPVVVSSHNEGRTSSETNRAITDNAPDDPTTPSTITTSIGMKLVLILRGEFMMGNSESAETLAGAYKQKYPIEPNAIKHEYPLHRVRLSKPFYLGIYKVTVGQFKTFVQDTGYQTDADKSNEEDVKQDRTWKNTRNWSNVFSPKEIGLVKTTMTDYQTDDHPVVYVSWNDAVAFCEWLSHKEGAQYRLPTEAEWEYACRAGSTTRYYFGDDDSQLGEYAWYADNLQSHRDGVLDILDSWTHPVGQKKPNAFGLYDMHGNAEEWCADLYAENYYSVSPVDDPQGPDSDHATSTPYNKYLSVWQSKHTRVKRGGDWGSAASDQRSAARRSGNPAAHFDTIGFRVARTP
jgi:formylglycine-generating enzyme